jgi:hypothetical protein
MDNHSIPTPLQPDNTAKTPENTYIWRRKFVEVMATSALTFSIVPSMCWWKNFVAPSDKITSLYRHWNTGHQGIIPLLANTDFRVVAVCDQQSYRI